jgi:hypothetical protein
MSRVAFAAQEYDRPYGQRNHGGDYVDQDYRVEESVHADLRLR